MIKDFPLLELFQVWKAERCQFISKIPETLQCSKSFFTS